MAVSFRAHPFKLDYREESLEATKDLSESEHKNSETDAETRFNW